MCCTSDVFALRGSCALLCVATGPPVVGGHDHLCGIDAQAYVGHMTTHPRIERPRRFHHSHSVGLRPVGCSSQPAALVPGPQHPNSPVGVLNTYQVQGCEPADGRTSPADSRTLVASHAAALRAGKGKKRHWALILRQASSSGCVAPAGHDGDLTTQMVLCTGVQKVLRW